MRTRKGVAFLVAILIFSSMATACGTKKNVGELAEITVNPVDAQETVNPVDTQETVNPLGSQEAIEPEISENAQTNGVTIAFPKLETIADYQEYRSEDTGDVVLTYNVETAGVDSKGYPELVKAVENWSENDVKNQKEQVDQLYEEALENYKLYKDTETVSYTFQQYLYQRRADAKIFSMEVCDEIDTDAAHRLSVYSGINFDTKTGKILTVDDIVLDRERFDTFIVESVKYTLKRYYKDDLFEDYMETVMRGLDSLNWVFTDYGIQIIYGEYELATYAAGTIRVSIPYSKLQGYVKEEYLPYTDTPAIFSLSCLDEYTVEINGEQRTICLDVENNFSDADGSHIKLAKLYLDDQEYDLADDSLLKKNSGLEVYCYKDGNGNVYLIIDLYNKDDEHVLTLSKLENGSLTQLDSIPGGIIEKTMHWSGFETYQSRGEYFSYEGKATYAIEDHEFNKIEN